MPGGEAQAALRQTNEDAAFTEARRRIAGGVPKLNFSDLTALRTLPPEIAGLTGLQRLDLTATGVTDLAPLAGLTELQWLYLTSTGVTDLAPLAGLTGLRGLGLTATGVTDLAPLAGLTSLRCLVLGPDDDIDLSPLAGLPEMKTVQSFKDC